MERAQFLPSVLSNARCAGRAGRRRAGGLAAGGRPLAGGGCRGAGGGIRRRQSLGLLACPSCPVQPQAARRLARAWQYNQRLGAAPPALHLQPCTSSLAPCGLRAPAAGWRSATSRPTSCGWRSLRCQCPYWCAPRWTARTRRVLHFFTSFFLLGCHQGCHRLLLRVERTQGGEDV